MFNNPVNSQLSVHFTYEYHTLQDGKRMRVGIAAPEWPHKPRGLAVITMGRANYIEKFSNTARELTDRGFLVLIPELPNQGLTDRFLGGKYRQRDYVPSIDYYVDCMDSFDNGIVKKYRDVFGPQLALSHSLGTLVNTEWMKKQATEETLKDKVALSIKKAPPYSFTTKPVRQILIDMAKDMLGREKKHMDPAQRVEVSQLVKGLSFFFVSVGLGKTYAWGQTDYNPEDPSFIHDLFTLITHNQRHVERIKKDFHNNDALVVGDVTWKTLRAMIKSIKRLHEPGYVEEINVPTLFLIGKNDELTPHRLSQPITDRFPNATLAIIPEAFHDLPAELRSIREVMWKDHIDPFIEEYMPERKIRGASLYAAAQ